MDGGGEVKKCNKPDKSCRRDQALSFRTHHHPCRQGVALVGTRQLRSQSPVSVYVHRTKEIAGSEGWKVANGVGGEIRVGGGNGDGNGVRGGNGDGDVDGDGDGAGAKTGVEANERTHDGNGDGSGDGAGTRAGTGVETRGRTQDGNGGGGGDGNERSRGNGIADRNEDGIGEGGEEAKKCKKPHKSCRRDMANGGDLGGKRKKRGQERVGSVTAEPHNLVNSKEAGGRAQGTQDLSKKCTSRESESPLSRLISGFRN